MLDLRFAKCEDDIDADADYKLCQVPSGLWPRVLAKITGPRDMSLLLYFL
jgi:hypothetical protein